MSRRKRRAACAAQGQRLTLRAVISPRPPVPEPTCQAEPVLRPVLTRVDQEAVSRLAAHFRRRPARAQP
jgi:hypothetical protein